MEFRSDSKTVYPVSVEFLSKNEISVILDLTAAEADKYRVYVENPSGLSDFSKQTIKIHERTDETELMMKGFKKDIITVTGDTHTDIVLIRKRIIITIIMMV